MRLFKYAVVVLLFCSFVAEATLIRRPGRASETSTNPQSYGLYNNSYMSTGYLVQGAPAINTVSFTIGDLELLAVPRDCWLIVPFGTLPPPEFWQEEPCYYEFEQGEQLDFEGALLWDFPAAFAAEFRWTLSQGEQSWDFLAERSDSFSPAALMPAELLPGQYWLSFTSTFYSGPDQDFYYRQTRDDCYPVFIDEGDDNCYYHLGRSSDVLSFTSPAEWVFILEPSAVQVPVPATISLFAGLLWFCRRQIFFGSRQR